jgi:murein DD-endopeptidase / murein LD-carboxypeptidase
MSRIIFVLAVILCGFSSPAAVANPFDNDTARQQCVLTPEASAEFAQLSDFYLRKYNILLSPDDNIKLFSMAKRWLGTAYRWGGRSKRGVDCQGFCAVVYDTLFNITLPGGAGAQYSILEPVKKSDLQTGDLVFFKIGPRYISHVGIYLKENKFVHSSTYGVGVIISDLDEAYYKRLFFSGGRLKNTTTAPKTAVDKS